MHFPLALLILLGVVAAALIITGSIWLALRIFGLKFSRSNFQKIIGVEIVFALLVGLIGAALNDSTGSVVLSIGSLALWIVLLRRYTNRYSLIRAIGSYFISAILALTLSAVAAVLFVAFFGQVFKIGDDSMAPALRPNDRVLVYKLNNRPSNNARILYRDLNGAAALGRVHGTPGQSVSIPAGHVVIANKAEDLSSYTLSSSQYYVTSDNAALNIWPYIIDSRDIIGTIGPKL